MPHLFGKDHHHSAVPIFLSERCSTVAHRSDNVLRSETTERAIVEVKGGENVSPQWVRALGNVVERERAKMGFLVMLGDPTVTMRKEAAAAGLYKTDYGSFQKIQILTVEDLFNGARPHMPWIDPSVFKKAKRENTESQGDLGI